MVIYYCTSCGAKFDEPKGYPPTCPTCGSSEIDFAATCTHCGKTMATSKMFCVAGKYYCQGCIEHCKETELLPSDYGMSD